MFGGALTLIVGEFLERLVCHIPKNEPWRRTRAGTTPRSTAKYYASWTAGTTCAWSRRWRRWSVFGIVLPLGTRKGAGYGGLP